MSSARDVFKQNLKKERQAQADAPSPRTVKDFVRICLPDIRRAVKQKTSWDIIAKAVHAVAKETYGVEIRIAPSTAKRAYYAVTSRKKRGKQSKLGSRSTSKPRKTKASIQAATPAPATTTAQAPQSSAPTSIPEPTPAPQPVARSPAAATTTGPAVSEPPTSENKQAAEELHPNRFRDRFKKVKNPKTTTGYENCKSL